MTSFDFIDSSFRVFLTYPRLLFPIIFMWIIYIPVLIFGINHINWYSSNLRDIIYPLFFLYFIFTTLTAIACSTLLEMIEQIENKREISFLKALKITFTENFNDILPILIVWSVLWIAATSIELIFSRVRKVYKTYRDVTSTNIKEEVEDEVDMAINFLKGDIKFTPSVLFIEVLKRGLRMIVFLILPAIAWDNLDFYDATKKAFKIITSEFLTFASGFLTTGIVILFIFLPPAIALYLQWTGNIQMKPFNYFVMAVYVLFALSYAMYIEQMFMAQIYLWYRKWEEIALKSVEKGYRIPPIEDIPVPSILDNINDLKK